MKIKLLLTVLALMLTVTASYASFPVKRSAVTTENTITNDEVSQDDIVEAIPAASSQKSQGVAVLLWFFLGGLAGHRWYLGSPWYWNILFILTAGGLGIWWVIDLIDILTGNYPAKGGFKDSFF